MTVSTPPNHYVRNSPTEKDRNVINAINDSIESKNSNLTRSIAQAVEKHFFETFKEKYNVDKVTTGSTCLRRLRGKKCKRGYKDSSHEHQIPHSDHRSLWLRDGEPALVVNHLYGLTWNKLVDIVNFCEKHDLVATVDANSWYFPTRTIMVVITYDG